LVVNSTSAGGSIGVGIAAGAIWGPLGIAVGGIIGGGVGY